MSLLSYLNKDIKDSNSIDKYKYKYDNKILLQKKKQTIEDKKNISKNKMLTESLDTSSSSDNQNRISSHIFNEATNPIYEDINKISDQNKTKENALTEKFFICNENYLREKNPEGNNYKKHSKNYILKNKFNSNKIKMEDININTNKINEILKNIEKFQNNKNIYLFNDVLNNYENKFVNKYNLPHIKSETYVDKNNNFYSKINNYNCKYICKLFNIIFKFFFSY